MAADSVQALIGVLAKYRLLEPNQLEKVRGTLAPKHVDANGLAKELVRRGWLTVYQVTHLGHGRSQELVLGPYILLEKLGEGGMGAVFKARHATLGRIVALKLIRQERLTNPDTIKRFQREIRAAAQLEHPNIVRAYDADEVKGVHFFVMEYVEGVDLAKVVKDRGPQPVAEACGYIRQAALGLQHAHERGMVHRDIKPANLLLSADKGPRTKGQGQIKILDMGLARLSQHEAEEFTALTREGSVMGTPDYIAPEQALSSHEVDIRADLYSLGCTFYYLLTAKAPFPTGSMTEKLLKHQMEEPTPVEQLRPEVPAAVGEIIRKLMAKRPADRYQTPAELVQALAGLESGNSTIPSMPPQPMPASSMPAATSAFGELQSTLTESMTEVIQTRRPAAASRRPPRQLTLVAAGGILLLLLVVFASRILFDDTKPSKTEEPVLAKKAIDKKKTSPALDPVAEAEKQRQAAEASTQKQRMAGADAALPELEARLAMPDVTFASFAKEVYAFRAKHGGTPAALKAAEKLMKLPSPLDQLVPVKIVEPAVKDGKTAAPDGIVALLGEPWALVPSPAFGLSVNQDGSLMAVAVERAVLLIDISSGRIKKTLPGASMTPVFSPDGKAVAYLSWPSSDIYLQEAETATLLAKLTGHTKQVWSIAFAPDGKSLASASEDGTVRLWDLKTYQEKKKFPAAIAFGHRGAVAIATDGKSLAARASDTTIKLYDPVSAAEQRTLTHAGVLAVTFSPDGKFIATSAADGTVKIWDKMSGGEVASFRGVGADAFHLVFSPDGQTLGVAKTHAQKRGQPSEIGLWDTATWKERAVLHHSDQVYDMAFSKDSRVLFSCQWASPLIRQWDVEGGDEVGATISVAFSPDHQSVLTAGANGKARAWDAVTRKSTVEFPGVAAWFLPDGRGFIGAGADGVLRSVDPRGEVRRTLGKATAVAISADGSCALVGQADGSLILQDLDNGQELRRFKGHDGAVKTTAFSADGRHALSGGDDMTVRLWNLATGMELARNNQHTGGVRHLCVSPDGRHVFSASSDGNVRIHLLDDSKLTSQVLGFHKKTITAQAISPDGRQLASSAADGEVILWDVPARKKLRDWQFAGPVFGLAFAADARHLATANGIGTVYILRISARAPKATSLSSASRDSQNVPTDGSCLHAHPRLTLHRSIKRKVDFS